MLVLLVLGSIAGTRATLSDTASAARIDVQGVTVGTPSGLTLTNSGGVLVSWTAPGSGATPTHHEVFRRTNGAAWGTVPIATVAHPTSSWTDTTAINCTSYIYRVRAVRSGIQGDPTAQRAFTPGDATQPTIVRSRIAGTSGLVDIADFIKPGGEFYAFVEVTDTCSEPEGIDVDLTLLDVGVPGPQPAAFGTWMAGGTTYNFRAGPFNSGAGLVDGALPIWSIAATDNGGTRNGAGTPARVDAIGPVAATAPEIVSASTNYFATSLGRGEVRPSQQFRAYARYTDARSGVPAADGAVTVDATSLGAGAVIPVPDGTFTTDNGIATWTRRSAAVTAGAVAEGVVNVSVTAQDAVGNATTATNVDVEVDGTALAVSSCDAGALSGGSNSLRQNDTTSLTFSDTVDPGSAAAGWSGGSAFSFNAVVQDGGPSNDRIVFNGLSLLAGSGAGQAFDLGAANWLAGTTETFAGSTLELPLRDRLLITYKTGGISIARQAASGTMQLASTVTDAAGNGVSPSAVICSTQW